MKQKIKNFAMANKIKNDLVALVAIAMTSLVWLSNSEAQTATTIPVVVSVNVTNKPVDYSPMFNVAIKRVTSVLTESRVEFSKILSNGYTKPKFVGRFVPGRYKISIFNNEFISTTGEFDISTQDKIFHYRMNVDYAGVGAMLYRNATFAFHEVPLKMNAGQKYTVSIEMTNSGTKPWLQQSGVSLGSQAIQDNKMWGLNRVPMAPGEVVGIGDSYIFEFEITAPVIPGNYPFQWRMVYEGPGSEWFGEPTDVLRIDVVDSPHSVRFSGSSSLPDFTNDKRAEYTDYWKSNAAFYAHFNRGNGSFDADNNWATAQSYSHPNILMIPGDFNGDGYSDYADLDITTGHYWVHAFIGGGNFQGIDDNWAKGQLPLSNQEEVVTGDFNRDGFDDFLVHNIATGAVTFHINPRTGGTTAFTQVNSSFKTLVGRYWRIGVGDFNNDGLDDLAQINQELGSIYFLNNTGSYSFAASPMVAQVAKGFEWKTLFGDFDGDGRTDYADLWLNTGEFWAHKNTPSGFESQHFYSGKSPARVFSDWAFLGEGVDLPNIEKLKAEIAASCNPPPGHVCVPGGQSVPIGSPAAIIYAPPASSLPKATIQSLIASTSRPIKTGETIAWSVTGHANGLPVEYRFRVSDGTNWIREVPYQSSGDFSHVAGHPGSYAIQVSVRTVGSVSDADAALESPRIQVTSLSLTMFAISVGSSIPAGQPLAAVMGVTGAAAEYQFAVFSLAENKITYASPYSSSRDFNYTILNPGQYQIHGHARTVGSQVPFEIQAVSGTFSVTAAGKGVLQGMLMGKGFKPLILPGAGIKIRPVTNPDWMYYAIAPTYTVELPAGSYVVEFGPTPNETIYYSNCRNCIEHPVNTYEKRQNYTVNIVAGQYNDLRVMSLTNPKPGRGVLQGMIMDESLRGLSLPGAAVVVRPLGGGGPMYFAAEPVFSATVEAGHYTLEFGTLAGRTTHMSVCKNCIEHPENSFAQNNSAVITVDGSEYNDVWISAARVGIPPGGVKVSAAGIGTAAEKRRHLFGDFNADGIDDLYVILTNGTGSGRTEVHVLDGATQFGRFAAHFATASGYRGDETNFSFGDYNRDGRLDLIMTMKNSTGSGRVEIHVLDGSTGFTTYLDHRATSVLALPANALATTGDYDNDGIVDLYVVLRNQTGSARMEVHVFDGRRGYTAAIANIVTAMTPISNSYVVNLEDFDGDNKLDLYFITDTTSTSGRPELHVLSGVSMYRQFTIQTPTHYYRSDDQILTATKRDGSLVPVRLQWTGTRSGYTEVQLGGRL